MAASRRAGAPSAPTPDVPPPGEPAEVDEAPPAPVTEQPEHLGAPANPDETKTTLVPESGPVDSELERQVREARGVSWAELDESGLRVLLVDESAADEVNRLAPAAGVPVLWVGTATGAVPPDFRSRVRLEDVVVIAEEEVEARVTLAWGGESIVGSGHGEASAAGLLYAAAEAVVDALRSFVPGLGIEGIYAATTSDGVPLLMISVLTEEGLFVGAVHVRPEEEALGAARAVLDALNRRLTRLPPRVAPS